MQWPRAHLDTDPSESCKKLFALPRRLRHDGIGRQARMGENPLEVTLRWVIVARLRDYGKAWMQKLKG